jgi:hypothetical protein
LPTKATSAVAVMMPTPGISRSRETGDLIGRGLQLPFGIEHVGFVGADLLARGPQRRPQEIADGAVGILDEAEHCGDDLARSDGDEDPELAKHAAQRIDPRCPGSKPSRPEPMDRREGLLQHGLDRDGPDVFVTVSLEQRFGIRAIRLIPGDVRADPVRGQEQDLVAHAVELTGPMVSGPAGFEQHE